MVVEKASGLGFPSPVGCREELLDPPDLATTTAAACSMFRGKAIADAKLTCSRQSLCVVNDRPIGNPKRKV
jgi:hypothetical protein